MSHEESDAAAQEERAGRYARWKRWLGLTDFFLGIALLAVLLFTGWTKDLRTAAHALAPGPAGTVGVYFFALTLLTMVVSFPLDVLRGHWLEHRFELSRQRFGSWLKDWLKGQGLSFLLGACGVELVYLALRRAPELWWLYCAAAFTLFFVLLAQLAPVLLFPLFFKFEPLQDTDLAQRLLRLSERVGARVRGVWLWKLSEKSKKSNAALVGWGRTRRIILADTLLERDTPDEIEVILAHELAHHVHNDIWKGLTLQTGLTFAAFYVVARALAAWTVPLGFSGPTDVANLPLLLLVGGSVSLVALPAANAFSRRLERRADAFALRTTGNREAFIGSMEKLAEQNLAQRRPHPWIEFVFHSHPSVEKRIAFARRWPPDGGGKTASAIMG